MDDLAVADHPRKFVLRDNAVGNTTTANLRRLLALESDVEEGQNGGLSGDTFFDNRREQTDDPCRYVVDELVDD